MKTGHVPRRPGLSRTWFVAGDDLQLLIFLPLLLNCLQVWNPIPNTKLIIFKMLIHLVCMMCMWRRKAHEAWHMGVRGQLCGVTSLHRHVGSGTELGWSGLATGTFIHWDISLAHKNVFKVRNDVSGRILGVITSQSMKIWDPVSSNSR